MGGDFKVLRDAIRKPMLRWWLRFGIWWVGAAVGLVIIDLSLRLHSYHSRLPSFSNQVPQPWLGITSSVVVAVSLLFAVAWLLAAIHCRNLITSFLDESTIHDQARYAPLLFRLTYCQGLYLILLVWLLNLSNETISHVRYMVPAVQKIYILSAIDNLGIATYAPLPLAISMIWLTGLLTLRPRNSWLAWGLLVANFGNTVFRNAARSMFNWDNYDFEASRFEPFQWYWLLGLVMMIGMLLAFKSNKHKAAWILYGLLTICVFSVIQFPIYLYINLNLGQMHIAYLPTYIGAVYNHVPQFGIFEWVWQLQTSQLLGTRLGQYMSLISIIISLLWPVALYALMYYVLLRPAREVEVTPE